MMGMSESSLAAFGRITGQAAANKIFEEAFAHLYKIADAPGAPLLPADEASIRTEMDKMMQSLSADLFNDLPKGTDVERALFLEAVRSAAVEHFMIRLKAKWDSMVTQ